MSAIAGFQRKNIRLARENYLGRRAYFVTLCFDERRRFGANSRIALWVIDELQKHAASSEFFVHAFCVMPDHVHVLATGASEASNLTKFIEAFKQDTAIEFVRRTRRRLWQFKYYDHILRSRDRADRVAGYIWMNPVRKGLCQSPADYPYQGSFTAMGEMLSGRGEAVQWMPPWKRQDSGAA